MKWNVYIEMLDNKIFIDTEELILMHELMKNGWKMSFSWVQDEVLDEYQLLEKNNENNGIHSLGI